MNFLRTITLNGDPLEIRGLPATLATRNIIIVGDSYLSGATLDNPTEENYCAVLKSFYPNANITPLATAGGGFLAPGEAGTFQIALNTFTGDKTAVTDIIFLGGTNDAPYSLTNSAALKAAITTTISQALTDYPNATLHVGYLSEIHGGSTDQQYMATKAQYDSAERCAHLYNASCPLKLINAIGSDGVHPSALGQRAVARYLYNYLTAQVDNWFDFISFQPVTWTDGMFSTTPEIKFNHTIDNGEFTLTSLIAYAFRMADGTYTLDGATGNDIDLGALGGMPWGNGEANFGSSAVVSISVAIVTSENYVKTGVGALYIKANHLYLNMQVADTGNSYYTGSIAQIRIPPFNLVCPASCI